jgi:HipA-like protein
MRRKDSESRLEVYLRDHSVGLLWLDEQRRFVFQYNLSWLTSQHAIPLSLSLPLQEVPYTDDAARPLLASGNAPSTHILKPSIQGLKETVENEAFCTMLAAQMGLSVPKVDHLAAEFSEKYGQAAIVEEISTLIRKSALKSGG